jgi:hypothetical protein
MTRLSLVRILRLYSSQICHFVFKWQNLWTDSLLDRAHVGSISLQDRLACPYPCPYPYPSTTRDLQSNFGE